MNLATGYIAQTLQTHDELIAERVNEQRRIASERHAEEGGRAAGRPSLVRRLSERLQGRGTSSAATRSTGAGADARAHAQGLRAAH